MNKGLVGLDLNIDKDFLSEAVRQTVIMGISEALNGKDEIVSQLVNSVLNTKVDKYGKISSYSGDNKYSLIEIQVKALLENEIKEEVATIMNENREEIRKVIRESFKKQKFQNSVVDAVMNSMVQQLTNSYRTTIEVKMNKNERDY